MKRVRIDLIKNITDTNVITSDEICLGHNFNKEHSFVNTLMEKGILYTNNEIDVKNFCDGCNQIIEDYNDYLLFKRSLADEKLKIIEQTVIKICENIEDVYSLNFSNAFLHVFARWVY